MKRSFFVLAVLFLSLLPGAIFAAASEESEYMAIFLDGHKIGHVIHSRKVEGSQVTTIDDTNMLIGRGTSAIQYTVKEVSIETAAGKPMGFEMIENSNGVEKIRKGTIQGGKVKMTIQSGPTRQESAIPYPPGALMTEGLRLLQIQKGSEPGQAYETLIFRPEMDQAVPVRVEVGGKSKIDLLGRILELSEVKMSMQVGQQDIVMTSYMDENFKALKNIVPMMGMNLEIVACEKDFALRQDNIVDFLDKLCAASPLPISKTDLAGPITYELVATTDKPLVFPTTDTQTVKELVSGRFHMVVQTIQPQGPVKCPYEGKNADIKKALEPTEYLQSKDPRIVDLVKHAVTNPEDAAKASLQIENFVMGYITKKDMSVGYASAAEVAQTRQGDCTEHAVLAAAMCRSAGIPARVVCGLVYADAFGTKKNVFVAHMWVEVYLSDSWFPIDPTRAPNGFSASHIVLARGDGNPTDFFSLVNTLGCFKIEKIILPSSPTPAPPPAK